MSAAEPVELTAEVIARLDAEDAEREARLQSVDALAGAALWYARHSIAVFPLRRGAKVPRVGSRGFHDATTDLDVIRAWWQAEPRSNIGIPTGHGFDVIDVDGPVGVKSWARVIDDLPPVLGHVCTPRPGGNHLYVPATGRGNRAGILPGVDYRGRSGYVVAPPSRSEVGIYRWIIPLDLAAVTR